MSQAEWPADTMDDSEAVTGSDLQSMQSEALRSHLGHLSGNDSARRMNRPERAPNLTAPTAWRAPIAPLSPYGLSASTPLFPPAPPPGGPLLQSPNPVSVSNMYLPGFHHPLMLPGLAPGESLFKPPLRFPPNIPSNHYLFTSRPPDSAAFMNPTMDPRLFIGRASPPFPRKLSPVVPAKPPNAFLNGPALRAGGLLASDLGSSCPSPSQATQHLPWSAEEVGGGTYRYQLPDRKATSFRRGTMIRMGQTCKRVEELVTSDFVRSAERHPEYSLERSLVEQIEENQSKDTARIEFSVGVRKDKVIMEVSVVQPFFVVDQGWSSCDPQRTQERLKLECHRLRVGNWCFSLANAPPLPIGAANGPRFFPDLSGPPMIPKAPLPHPLTVPLGPPPPPPAHPAHPAHPMPIPLPELQVDVETVGEAETDMAGGNKFYKKNQRWPWDSNSPSE